MAHSYGTVYSSQLRPNLLVFVFFDRFRFRLDAQQDLEASKQMVNVALEADQVDERSYTFGIKLICRKASQRQCWAAAENDFCVNPRARKIYVLNIG